MQSIEITLSSISGERLLFFWSMSEKLHEIHFDKLWWRGEYCNRRCSLHTSFPWHHSPKMATDFSMGLCGWEELQWSCHYLEANCAGNWERMTTGWPALGLIFLWWFSTCPLASSLIFVWQPRQKWLMPAGLWRRACVSARLLSSYSAPPWNSFRLHLPSLTLLYSKSPAGFALDIHTPSR